MQRNTLFAWGIGLILGITGCYEGSIIEDRNAEIVNGNLSPGDRYPAIGALVAIGGPADGAICTGTLITQRAVLTAAHCLFAPNQGPALAAQNIFWVPGNIDDVNLATSADRLPASDLIADSRYNPAAGPEPLAAHDIGLVILQDPVTSISPQQLVLDDEGSVVALNAEVLLVGYGRRQPSGTDPAGRKAEGTAYITQVAAGDEDFATGLRDGDDAGAAFGCFGDSGGPVLKNNRVIGVISRAGEPGEFTCTSETVHTAVNPSLDTFILGNIPDELPCGSGPKDPCADGATAGGDGGTGTTDPNDPGGTLLPAGPRIPRDYEPKTRGCATGGGPSLALSLLALCWLVTRRRRR